NRIFEKSLKKTEKGKPFTFYDGPPFATGLPHYGHILASTIKDVIPRYQTMKGRFVRRRWGWDCHGLPIEEIVEHSLGISGKKQIEEIGIQKFNETCRSKVLEFADEWGKMVRRIARWIDFDNSYKTMDRDYMESVWWAFKQIYNKGLVYEGRKVLMYCPRCETPISNFEVAMDNSYKDVTEETVMVKFPAKGRSDSEESSDSMSGSALGGKFKNTYILAWTTTPWTLPGNVALAINPDVAYVKCRVGKENFVLAKERLVILNEPHEIIREFKGKDLIGLSYEPLFDGPAVKSNKAF
ncbi:isoleucine--tRNA ligase, partial [Candidatus Shapirobacteria bacterium CG09_land_8_20_14_0_10_39_12]